MKVKDDSGLTSGQPRVGNTSRAMRNLYQNKVTLAAAVVCMRSYTAIAMQVIHFAIEKVFFSGNETTI
jgi:hypothetical protein